jgi:hypothetical protein
MVQAYLCMYVAYLYIRVSGVTNRHVASPIYLTARRFIPRWLSRAPEPGLVFFPITGDKNATNERVSVIPSFYDSLEILLVMD